MKKIKMAVVLAAVSVSLLFGNTVVKPTSLIKDTVVTHAAKPISKKSARKRIMKVIKSNGDYSPNCFLDFDHEEGDEYVFQYYEVVTERGEGSHTSTWNWYIINKYTKKVRTMF